MVWDGNDESLTFFSFFFSDVTYMMVAAVGIFTLEAFLYGNYVFGLDEIHI